MSQELINALRAHALVIALCTEAQKQIIGMFAENMQREHRGESMAYAEEAFAEIKSPGWNEVISLFNRNDI